MDWKDLAKKFAHGFRKGNISQKGMGVTNSEMTMLRNMKNKEGYDGQIPFFICKKVYENFQKEKERCEKFIKELHDSDLMNEKDVNRFMEHFSRVQNQFNNIDFAINENDANVRLCISIYELQQK